MDAFDAAQKSFLSSLGSEDVTTLNSHNTAEDVLAEVEKAEEEHRGKCNTRNYMKNIENFVKRVEQYGKVLDVYMNAKPEVLSLIWGTARLLALDYLEFYENLLDMFRQLGKTLGRFGIYARLYPRSDRLKSSLIAATFVIIDALDECDDRDKLLYFIVESSKSTPNLNLLATSRNEKDIHDTLQGLPQVELTDANTTLDIRIFVVARLEEMIKNRKLKLRDQNLRHEIFDSLCSRADGILSRFLLENGFTPNVKRSHQAVEDGECPYFGEVPLPLAIPIGRFDLADLLLDHDGDPNLADEYSGNPLYAAVMVQNVRLVCKLLELGARPNEDITTGDSCSNIVHIASRYQHPTILQKLLQHGADANTHCYSCPSALRSAIKAQRIGTIDILVSHRADVSEPDAYGRVPMSRARDLA
ncbi:hypothetical protein LTR84_009343 [Exophiala bonariae]|uniref:NACHT domain-containing protein n=1 Tax=Exophiala bonariae TaxID=1690606 RepID=A0AAV9MUS9_9EURO|nr:hypothetical protein LTR84_009343 [Exophiala bonariae]